MPTGRPTHNHLYPSKALRARILKLTVGAGVLTAIGVGVFWYERGRTVPSLTNLAIGKTVPGQQQAYAGSASCRECHAEAFEAWQGSHHGLAERALDASLDRRAFQPPRTFQHGSQHTSVSSTNGAYKVTALQATNHYATFAVERVIGVDPLRQFLVGFPDGRLQTLEAAYDARMNEWFNVYGSQDRQPGEWGHWTGRGMNWNSMCATCHNTRVQKNYDVSRDSYRTTMAEMTVGCEACHGPLQAHNDWQKRYGRSGRKDPALLHLAPDQTMDNCGFCHARRGDLTGDFQPGDNFLDHMRLALVDNSQTFYPDGQVRDEDYEYAAFLGSRMHWRGVRCLDCHEPHLAKTRLPGNWLCLRCHNGSDTNAPAINPSTHSHHQVFGFDTNGQPTNLDLLAYKPKEIKETGGECVNCHMPQTVYMQRHWRHDHGFTIPDPLLTLQFGTPNACNRCHQDKDARWSLEWSERWYGAKLDRPSRRRAQIVAKAQAGDPGAHQGLLEMLSHEEIPYWRGVAAGLLQPWATDPATSDAVLRGLSDTNALVRESCVRALEPILETNSARINEAVQRRLADPVRTVRLAAAWGLRASLDPSSRAGRELLQALQLNSDQPLGQMQQGAYALARKEPLTALAHYQKAVEWDPNSAPIRHELAVLLSSLGRGEEAVRQLETACALEPLSGEYRFLLALAWNEVGQTAQTIENLQAAVKLEPRHARAWYNLGLALNRDSRGEEALSALIRAESISPDDPAIPYARATILAQLGRSDEARVAANRALEIRPGYPPAGEILRSLR